MIVALGPPGARAAVAAGLAEEGVPFAAGDRAGDAGGLGPEAARAAHAWEEAEHPQLRDERLLFAAACEHDVPALGLCLGGQILARALGGETMPGDRGEFGWVDIEPLPAAAGDPIMAPALEAPPRVYE